MAESLPERPGEPRVALLLSTFNGARFLPDQLESLLDQTYDNWILYWRDDGSADETVALLEAFSREAGAGRCVRLQVTDARLQPTASYLTLLDAVRDRLGAADMVAFVDQDDVWLAEKLARGVAALTAQETGAPLIYCARQILVDETLRHIGVSQSMRGSVGFPASLTQNLTTGCTIVLNRSAAELIATSVPPPVTLHDWWCYLVVSAAGGRLVADEAATVLYRQHAGNAIGAHHTLLRRAIAAIRRGPGAYMELMRAHVAALRGQPHLLCEATRSPLSAIARAIDGGVLARLRGLAVPGFTRRTLAERFGFWAWFLAG